MITIHGTGCCLIDFLYPKTDFSAPAFREKLSLEDGDGGLAIGKLVFAENFEKFVKAPYENALKEIAGGTPSHNLGGPAVVPIVHAAQVLGSGVSARVCFYGVRGDDETGGLVEEALVRAGFTPPNLPERVPAGQGAAQTKPDGGVRPGQSAGTTASYTLTRCKGPTPRTDVLSDPSYNNGHGERTFINLIGAAGEFGPEDLGDGFFDADIVAFGGTALTPKIHDSLAELLGRAKQRGARTVVNLVYDYRSEQAAPGKKWKLGKNDNAYPRIDLLIADKDEALRTSGCSSTGDAARWFVKEGCGAAIITEGTKPLRLTAGAGLFKPLAETELPVSEAINRELAAHPEKRGDTTGCGDNFAGGVIAGLAEKMDRLPAGTTGGIDLREICIPGIIAGGYACFTLGGVFYENRPGEKRELLAPFIEVYKREVPFR
ncbi:MAG: PfkB family carbohydrate kinase [Treponema sp.]|jgi:sugar/nucleoside kinase (ribokinase family)|nr:PfkB family carbohydrate kinase [Treponema sp.]